MTITAVGCTLGGSKLSPENILDYAGNREAAVYDCYRDCLYSADKVTGSFAFRTTGSEVAGMGDTDRLGLGRFTSTNSRPAEELAAYFVAGDGGTLRIMLLSAAYKDESTAQVTFKQYAAKLKANYKTGAEVKSGLWHDLRIITIVPEDKSQFSAVGVYQEDRYLMIMIETDPTGYCAAFNGISDDLELPDLYVK